MAKIKENLLTKGFSGKVGNEMVFRQVDGETLVTKRRAKRGLLTPKEQVVKDRFMDSVFYAKSALPNPSTREFYESAKKSFKARSAYAAAVSDYLTSPKLVRANVENYKGNEGNAIYVIAENNFKIREMTLQILRADGTLVESGPATPGDDAWYYHAKVDNTTFAGGKIIVTAKDRPGKTATLEVVV